MPDRLVRDELLRSHRYRTLSSDTARLLFMHLLLIVDAFGNTEASSVTVADALHRQVDEVIGAKLLSELADADLIRMYDIDGKKFLHVPRLRQRLRYMTSKHPRPPPQIECKEIKRLEEKVRLSHGEDTTKTVEVKRSEERKNKTPDAFDKFWGSYPRKQKKPAAEAAFRKLKVDDALLSRMLSAISLAKHTTEWLRDGGNYIPHASSWLNQRRWEDEPNGSVSTPAKKVAL